jgi:hypothetical protein
MPDPPTACPLCTTLGARVTTLPAGTGPNVALQLECPLHCGTVAVEARFLTHHWPHLPAQERAALVRWLAATRETRGTLPLILAEDSYRLYLREAEARGARSAR